MPEWGTLALTVAGAVIVILVGVIAKFYHREWQRQDEDKQVLSKVMAEGFSKLEGLIGGVAAQAQRLERDCVTWEEFNKLKADVTHHSTEIAVIRTTCKSEHGK